MKNNRFKEIDDLLDQLKGEALHSVSDEEGRDSLISRAKSVIKENYIQAVNESKTQFENLFEHSPNAILIHDFDKITQVNQAFLDMFGYADKGEVVGKSAMNTLVSPEDYEIIKNIKEKLKTEKIGFVPIVRLLKKDGTIILSENYASNILINGIPHLQINCNEITERENARIELTESKNQFFNLFKYSPDATFIHDFNVITHVNNAFLDLFGYDNENEIIGLDPLITLNLSEDYDRIKSVRHRFEKENFIFLPETKQVKKDGSVFFSESYVSKVIIDGIPHLQVSSRDVTERKNARNDLEESKKRYKELFEHSPDALFLHSKGVIYDVNTEFLNLFKYKSKKDIIGKPALKTLVLKEDYTVIEDARNRLDKEKVILLPKVMQIKSDGSVFTSESYVSKFDIGGVSYIQVNSRDITKKLELENRLMSSEEKFKGLFNSMGDLFTRVTNKGIVEIVSPSVYDLFGYKPGELIGENTDEFYIDLAHREKFLEEVTKNGFCKNYEIAMIAKNGDVKILSVNSKIYYDKKGDPAGIESLSRDITDKINSERDAVRYGKIFEDSLNEVYLFETDTLKFVQANPAALKNIGYSIEELKELTVLNIKPNIEKEEFLKIVGPLVGNEKEKILFETVHLRKDGSFYQVEVHLQILNYLDEKLFAAIISDITDKKKSEQKYKSIVDSLVDILVQINHKGIVELVSPSVKLMGYNPEELLGEPVLDFYVNKEDREGYINQIKEFGFCHHYEAKIYAKDGSIMDIIGNGKLYLDEFGEYGVESIFRDITSYKKQQDKLVNNERLLATINDNSPDLIISIDDEYKVLYMNKVLDGFELENVIGANVMDFVPESFQNQYVKKLEKGFNGEKCDFEMEGYVENGSTAWYSVRLSPVIEDNEVISLLIISTDITKRKKVEKENEVINAISQKINSKLDVNSFCEFVFAEFKKIRPSNDVYIANYDPIINKVSFFYETINGIRISGLPEDRIAGNGLTEYLIKTRKGLILNEEDLPLFYKENGVNPYDKPAKSWVGVPLISEGNVIGVLVFQNFEESGYYTNYHLDLLAFIGSQLVSIMEREKSEKELLTQKERLTLATTSSNMGVFDWDIKSDTLIWDDVMYDVFGVKAGDFGSNFEAWSSSLHPDDVEKSNAEVDMALQGLKDFNTGFRIVLPDKSIRHIQGVGKVLMNEENEPYRMIGLNWDVSKEKRMEDMVKGVADIQEAFITAESATESFNKMLNILIEVTDSQYGFVGEVVIDDDGVPYLKTRAATDISWNKETKTYYDDNIEEGLKFKNLKTLFGHVMVTKEAVVSNNPTTDSRSGGLPAGHPKMDNFMGVPIFHNEDFIGMVGVANKPSGYTTEDVDMLNPFLATCSTVMKGYQNAIEKNVAEKRVRELADIVSYSSDAIISSNNDGEIVSWNAGAVNLLGYTANEVIGTSISNLLFKKGLLNLKNKVQVTENVESYDTIQINKKGNEIPVSMSIFPLIDENGEVKGMSSILRDISEQKEVEKLKDEFTKNLEISVKKRTKDLEQAKKELAVSLEKEKVLNELKSRFVATASHQFRTPLSVIQAGVGVLELQRGDMSEKLKKSFDKIYSRVEGQISKMTNLMDEVLILGNINSESQKVNLKALNLVELCNSIVSLHNDIQKDGRVMEVQTKGVKYKIKLDKNLIEHALSNMISNSFKFSLGKEPPTLILNFKESEVQLIIRDRGIGIPKNELVHFFDPFYRASNVGEISGTGLGSAIAKDYIELNNGTIEVNSEINVGTELVITFKR